MEKLKEIESINDIQQMVNSFYAKVQKDDLIGPIFQERIQNRWPEHLEKMYRFWETVLLDNHSYYGSPCAPHATMPIEEKHFDRWLSLFKQNLEEQYIGSKAEEALWRAKKMAQMFNYKIEYIRKNNL